MLNDRRKSKRMAAKMTVDLMLTCQSGETLAGPVNVELDTFSLHGGSVLLPSIQVNGVHLFFDCTDKKTCCLVLRFNDDSDQSCAISCRPVWFDRKLNEDPAYYKMGFEFFRPEERDNIRLLNRMTRGRSDKSLFKILGDFFTRS